MGKDVSRSHQEQLSAGIAADKMLDFEVYAANNLSPRALRWKTRDGDHVMNLWYMLQYWIIRDGFSMMKQKWLAETAHVTDSYRPVSEMPPEIMAEMQRHYQSRERDVKFDLPPDMAQNLKRVGLKPIKHFTEMNFIRTHNPLASGTLMFDVCLDMEHAGTTLANITKPSSRSLTSTPPCGRQRL